MMTLAAIQKAPEPIPELRPPKGELGLATSNSIFFTGALLFALIVLIVGRIWKLRQPQPLLPGHSPLASFQREISQIPPDDPDQLDRAIHAVRRYVCDAYEIGSEGLTNEELIAEFADHPAARDESATALYDFLAGSDFLRFAPVDGGKQNAVQRATEVVEILEKQRTSATPPPIPVAS